MSGGSREVPGVLRIVRGYLLTEPMTLLFWTAVWAGLLEGRGDVEQQRRGGAVGAQRHDVEDEGLRQYKRVLEYCSRYGIR